ncbi:MAG: hypothetical protein Q8O76_13560 [Chloroflexota bacterium]|nr:hypothetical protein [Chloroflexota bacterium]
MNWDEYQQAVQAGGFKAAEKAEILQGIGYLRNYLGEDCPEPQWLKYQREQGKLEGKFPRWALFRAAQIGDTLHQLEAISGFRKLLKRLRQPEEYAAAEAEVEVAGRLQRLGLPIELQPRVGNGKADIKLLSDPQPIYFEVTTLLASGEERLFWLTLSKAAAASGLQPGEMAPLNSLPTKGRLMDSSADIERRVCEKIQEKMDHSKQLPPNSPGIIVISGSHFNSLGRPESALNFACKISDTVFSFPSLVFVLLTWFSTTKMLPAEETVDDCRYFRKHRNEMEWELVAIKNVHSKFSLGKFEDELIPALAEP